MTTVVVSEEERTALKTLHPALNGCSRTLALPISYFTRKLRRTLGADVDMTSKINGSAMTNLAMKQIGLQLAQTHQLRLGALQCIGKDYMLGARSSATTRRITISASFTFHVHKVLRYTSIGPRTFKEVSMTRYGPSRSSGTDL